LNQEKVGAVIVGGDFQGLGILRSLAKRDIPVCLLDSEFCGGRFSRYKKRFIKCPNPENEAIFLNFLKVLAEKESLKGWIIFPTNDETVYILSKYRTQLEKYYRITTPSWDVVKFAYDKKLTYRLAQESGIDIPKTFYPRNLNELHQLNLQFPIIIKPSIKDHFYSKTRLKAIQVNNKRELTEVFKKTLSIIDGSEIMIQDLIPGGPEYLFSFCSLFRGGEVLAKITARRARQHPMDFGHASTFVETVNIPELEEIGKKFLKIINYYGLSEIEFMEDPRDGKYKLLEVNARTWGWHTLAIRAGVDFPYLLYLNMLGETVKNSSFRQNIKWIRLTTDIPTVFTEIFKRKMKITDYLNSLKGEKEFAVLSLKDPLPFIIELLLLPYLWKKRGF